MKFTKMHGIGNDYVYVNCFEERVCDPPALAKTISHRHFGVGSDGLILICPSQIADVRMRMFNADGSEAEMCGNGIRCVAKYACDHKLAQPGEAFSVPGGAAFPGSLRIETLRGVLKLGARLNTKGLVESVCVNMGEPVLEPSRIPVTLEGDRVVGEPLTIESLELKMTCVSMGNPHAVFFCEDLDQIPLAQIGPLVERHALFPKRTNVHFVKINGPQELTMRTWERGSGITLACGTGACACCVAAAINHKADRACTAHLPGGDLQLNWSNEDNAVYMTGPATEVFEGDWPD